MFTKEVFIYAGATFVATIIGQAIYGKFIAGKLNSTDADADADADADE